MTIQECYTALHGNYNDALGRLMNDRLIGKFILKFLDDKTMSQLVEAVAKNDREAAFMAAHTMKGVAANLAFCGLQRAASDLTEQLRPRQEDPSTALFQTVQAAYDEVVNAIHAWQQSPE